MNPALDARPRLTTLDGYRARCGEAARDPDGFWLAEASRLHWFVPPPVGATHRADFDQADISWFEGGRLNACWNCVDRHAARTPDRIALIWAANEPGRYERISYRDLLARVGRMGNLLRSMGVRRGDRVCLYMPMAPDLAVAVLACARIGAVHSAVFAGFSAESLRDRMVDAGCSVLITADEGVRGDKVIPLKRIADAALAGMPEGAGAGAGAGAGIQVLVSRRTGGDVPMQEGRDRWLDAALAEQRPACPVEWMDAEDPLFLLYTSGSTGRPKGVLHTTGGYLTYACSTFAAVFDVRDDDIHFCTADIGWITGHSYILYGPLACGITSVLGESPPNWPDARRCWQICDDLQATILYTAPTALRALMRAGDGPVEACSRRSLRLLGTVGEPINPEVWRWYHDVVGGGRCPVIDTWWQTETGGVLIAPLPGLTPPKPGSATLPLPGIAPVLVDDQGVELIGGDVRGNLCLRGSWPGQARTVYNDHARFRQTYFSTFPGLYFTGDGCWRDADGNYWITGRVDDVLNVSGHRLGTAEIESALVAHPAVAEAAVVGAPHPLKGTGVVAYVQQRANSDVPPADLPALLRAQARTVIGALATPDAIFVVSGLPKTRSGKIMRRILRKIACDEADSIGDTSTLAEPAVVEELVRLGPVRF